MQCTMIFCSFIYTFSLSVDQLTNLNDENLTIYFNVSLLRSEMIGNKQRSGSLRLADKYMQEMAEFIDAIREVEALLVEDIM